MKMDSIIASIADAHEFATALKTIGTIAAREPQAVDVAAIAQVAKRLNEKLDAAKRGIDRAVAEMAKGTRETAGKPAEDILELLRQ